MAGDDRGRPAEDRASTPTLYGPPQAGLCSSREARRLRGTRMRPVVPQVMSGTDTEASSTPRRMPLRLTRAANDNHRTHAPWRRLVAASMAAIFAASLILVGLACIARAEPLASFTIGN